MSEHNKKFEVMSKMEQRPFENQAVNSFFYKWCEINGSIRPLVLTREEWEQKSVSGLFLLENGPDGKQNLLIPEDLQLWEMVEVVEAVDQNTFADKPERQKEKKEELLKLGRTFSNAGIYIAQRLNAIPQGKEIASALAEEFYWYGQSLASGKRLNSDNNIENIASYTLTPEEVVEVDRFLAGESLYAARQARAEKIMRKDPEKKDEIYEAERQKTLAQFFRVAEKAPIHSAFLRKVERGMEKQIETPRRELTASIFRRGMDLLKKNMPFDKLPESTKNCVLHWEEGETTLREALGIDQLKTELETIRQTGNLAATGGKEREIADKIQAVVSKFSYQSEANNPAEMVANQSINCVGASMLGGAFLSEIGIKHVVGLVPEHLILMLVESDGRVEWRDMLNPESTEEIIDEEIEGKSKTGVPLTVQDIIVYANNPLPEGLMLDIKGEGYRKKFGHVQEGQRQFLTIFPSEIGQKIMVLTNFASMLYGDGRYEEAAEAYREAVALNPNYANSYHGLGDAYYALGRDKEAIEAYRQAVVVDPEYAFTYHGLGNVFSVLGRDKEAIEAYRQFISLANKENDEYWIKRAEAEIKKLE